MITIKKKRKKSHEEWIKVILWDVVKGMSLPEH